MKRQLGQHVALLGIFLVISGISVFPVFAEEADSGTGVSSPMSLARTQASAPSSSHSAPAKAAVVKVEKTAAGRYYLDFKAASLINVLNVLSSLSGINFVAGPEVADRKVNMTLDNVSLEDVLQSISSGSNVSYDSLPGRNIYLFRASSDSPEKPPLITRVFRLYYVLVSALKEIGDSSSSFGSGTSGGSSSSGSSSSSGGSSSGGLSSGSSGSSSSGSSSSSDSSTVSIVTAVEKILSERGKVSVDDRSNSLIVTDSEDRLRMVESAIMQLDRPLDQVLINVLLVETYEDLTRNLGVTWGDENGSFGTVTGGTQTTNFPFLNGATDTASANSTNFFKGLYKGLANVPDQFNPGKTTGTIVQGSRDFTSFSVSLTALEKASKLKILAKPKVLVLDNHPAIVKISTNAAIGSTSVTASAGGSSGTNTTTTERAEVGTILRVTPLINTKDRITMTVEPTFATVDASAIKIGLPNNGVTGDPTVRSARTTLMVNDGQTIALGGLLMSNQSNGNRKVPFFGNLPVVGKALFTSNDKTMQNRELILFVTPYIIRDPSALQTSSVPDKRLSYEDEAAPFWKVKQKEWYRELKDGPEKQIDFESYFNIRKKLMETTLAAMDQNEKAASQEKP
jgi:type II secretory pathway component GspD/PulD (secretin)